MKNILSVLSTIGVVSSLTFSVVACGTKSEKEPKKKSLAPPISEKKFPKPPKPETIPLEKERGTQIKKIEDINNEKIRKMKYFNELNSTIQKNRTKIEERIRTLEIKNNNLEQKQISIKEEINQKQEEIELLNNQVSINGIDAVEWNFKKRIRIAENIKNREILELFITQQIENKEEMELLKKQKKQEKFYISEIDSISSPTKIIVPITQKEDKKIYAMEKDIKKIVLNQLKEKFDDSLTEYDFIIEFESKCINHTGTVEIELSHSKKIKIKIHGKNNLVGETNWISISLPPATAIAV